MSKFWRHTQQWPTYAGAFIGILIGGALTWIAAKPPPPWIEFKQLHAVYEPGSTRIGVYGQYVVHAECKRNGAGPPGWRIEAMAPDGQIALYGPAPGAPNLAVGEYSYSESLPLAEPINPDGWRVWVLARCQGQEPALVTSNPVPLAVSPDNIPGPR